MCTYVVTYRVIGECNVVVEASNASDAIQRPFGNMESRQTASWNDDREAK